MAPTASASNASSSVSYGGVVRGTASWTDVTDNLCVTATGGDGINIATAKIRPANGSGPSFTISDLTDTSGGQCTGNLSIPEDRAYILTLQWDSEGGVRRTATPKNFYT
ncbi:hypothetical protein VV02_11200 [Luteipulveratus mongoliensis]|uniref:Uncharacterized protein n=2 Tax=Luteipulveratus mongoliensis TaxID=571913 RepID=A0A0K1JI91_9MICO|nr:hypothetical protein VV02_11200 [Luteipulveratus mongoliensis]